VVSGGGGPGDGSAPLLWAPVVAGARPAGAPCWLAPRPRCAPARWRSDPSSRPTRWRPVLAGAPASLALRPLEPPDPLAPGHQPWGMGHGAWGMGHGAWGMGHKKTPGASSRLGHPQPWGISAT
jgi:hypothetical protein